MDENQEKKERLAEFNKNTEMRRKFNNAKL